MEIKILGTGCTKCATLEKITRQVVEELNIDAKVEKVDDIQKIIEYGVMSTPSMIINDKVVVKGKVPKASKLKDIILQNQ